jgi:hypothetical protein
MLETMRSVRTDKMSAAKQALLTVLENLPADAKIGVLLLNGRSGEHWVVRLGPVDRGRLRNALGMIHAHGGTPLGEYIKVGADALLELRAQERYGTYKLLIVTDGEASDQRLLEDYLPDILSRGIMVDVIGVDMRQDHSLATMVQTYRRADDPASLQQAISEMVLGESSTDDTDDTGDSDFELLGGLPDEVASAAVEALASQQNEPIRAKASLVPGEGGGTVPASTRRSRSSTAWSFLSGCCGMTCLGFLVFFVVIILVSKKR